jgi:hypothetical protein
MEAIKTIVDRNKIASLFNIPESYGEKVEVIILPAAPSGDEFLHSQSTEMMQLQEKSGFVQSVLGNEAEDVWNDL